MDCSLFKSRSNPEEARSKKEFLQQVGSTVVEHPPHQEEDVFVVLVDTEFEDWTFGSGIAQMIERP